MVTVDRVRWWTAFALAVLVNVCTHPVLWWMLAHPTLQQTLMAEAVVAEAALQAVAVRRDVAVLAQLSLAANTSSLFVGPLLN